MNDEKLSMKKHFTADSIMAGGLDIAAARESMQRECAKVNPTSILASRINLVQAEMKDILNSV